MTPVRQALIELLKVGIGNSVECRIPHSVQWGQVLGIAQMQGVGSVVLDGVEKSKLEGISKEVLLQWIAYTQQQENRYVLQEKLIAELASFYQEYNIPMMVLKGWGLSLLYPNPNHRPYSDLDIYLYGKQKEGDAALEDWFKSLNVKEFKIDNSHHHHSVFVYKGLSVENHYDFINVYSHSSNKKVEKRLKSLVKETPNVMVKVNGVEVWLPSPDFNALFLLRHAAAHFAGSEISLRQVVDWGLFMQHYHKQVDWGSLMPFIKEMNMHHFLGAINYICYHYLGFNKEVFISCIDESFGDKVFEELFNPMHEKSKVKGTVRYIYSRFRYWWSNRWKHRIVYSDSLLTTFLVQFFAHLMKPTTLRN